MTAVLSQEGATMAPPRETPKSVDTVRALCHDLRQPLAAILLLAGSESGDVQRRLGGILDQAQWLSELVEGVIGGAADDAPESFDVVDLALRCVLLARPTASCQIEFSGPVSVMATAAPVALSRAIGCILDNAVRAAGPGGSVKVEVTADAKESIIRISDNGPGLGKVPIQNSLGLTITRALVCAFGGEFQLQPGTGCGMVAQIIVPTHTYTAVAS